MKAVPFMPVLVNTHTLYDFEIAAVALGRSGNSVSLTGVILIGSKSTVHPYPAGVSVGCRR